MSYSPHGLGFLAPTGGSLSLALPVCQAYASRSDALLPASPAFVAASPKLKAVVVPARQQYSHSASVGSRISSSLPMSCASRSLAVILRQNSRASFQSNISTELRGPFHLLGLAPISAS